MIYVFLGIIVVAIAFVLSLLFDIQIKLCSILVNTERTYDIVNKWAIYYVCEEHSKGNNNPFDCIFPDDRKIVEEKMKQEECHIDNKK